FRSLVVVALVPVVPTQDVASHAEQVSAEARVAAEPVSALDAGEKGSLDQVIDLVGGLVGEEPADAVEVAVEQLVAGPRVARPPRVEQVDEIGRASGRG